MRCYSCEHYQVTQRRADSKFTCKICGSRQSVRNIPARSHNAAQLRPLVQRANMARGDAQLLFDQFQQSSPEPDSDHTSNHEQAEETVPIPSRWTPYVRALKTEAPTPSSDKATQDHDSVSEVITSLPDRQRKRRRREMPQQAIPGLEAPSECIYKLDALPERNVSASNSEPNCEKDRTQELQHPVSSSEVLKNAESTSVNVSEFVERSSNKNNDGWGSQWGTNDEEAWK